MSRIGILGGTFNPVHVGHLMVAEDVRGLFALNRVIFVSSSVPPHKDNKGILTPEHRHRMLSLAVEGNPHFGVSSVELDRGGKSYSVDTVAHFRGIYGPESSIYFIVGIDAFVELPTWHDVSKLFPLCKFIVVTRTGTNLTESALSFLNDFGKIRVERVSRKETLDLTEENIGVYLVESIRVDISSSDIRASVRAERSIRYLVPQKVEEYIHKKDLFRL
jgi:nicotinate-nucleotide adenylyltransferase